MAEHNELGKEGEAYALGYLQQKGIKILEQNWRSGNLEVDIIGEDVVNKQIVFYEVRTRMSNYVMEPEYSVDRKKQRNLITAANRYIQYKNIQLEARFDIVAILVVKGQMQLNHLEDAFQPIV